MVKEHLEEGGNPAWTGLSLSPHCTRIFETIEQTQSQPSPNLSLVKISHFFLPILSKPCTAEQSVLLDQICCWLSCNIPCLQSLDYTIKLHSFAFQSLSPSSKAQTYRIMNDKKPQKYAYTRHAHIEEHVLHRNARRRWLFDHFSVREQSPFSQLFLSRLFTANVIHSSSLSTHSWVSLAARL